MGLVGPRPLQTYLKLYVKIQSIYSNRTVISILFACVTQFSVREHSLQIALFSGLVRQFAHAVNCYL